MPFVTALETNLCLADWTGQLCLVLVRGANHLPTLGLWAPAHKRVLIILLLLLEALILCAQLRPVIVCQDLLHLGVCNFLAAGAALDFLELRVADFLLQEVKRALRTKAMLAIELYR